MFPIFKSKRDPVALYKELQQEIDTSAERAVKAAQKIVNDAEVVENETYTKLSTLGFGRVQVINKHLTSVSDVINNKKLLEDITYFQQAYPFNKYVTARDVETICKKYKLIQGSAYQYIGHIPTKNQREIVNFKIKYKDTPTFRTTWHNALYSGSEEVRLIQQKELTEQGEKVLDGNNLVILAPKKMFDRTGMKIVNRKLVDEDPVVLQPLRDRGYLVVSAWGPEASDELVVNPRMS